MVNRGCFLSQSTRLIILIALCLPHIGQAQPTAISPQDVERFRQQTEVISDWAQTDLFNIERYITLRVTIHRLKVPKRDGHVHLWFTLNNPERFSRTAELPAGRRYKALLQSKAVFERLGFGSRDFPNGVQAVVRGWPATKKNLSSSVLLVDEILVQGRNKRIAFHADNPDMNRSNNEVTLE